MLTTRHIGINRQHMVIDTSQKSRHVRKIQRQVNKLNSDLKELMETIPEDMLFGHTGLGRLLWKQVTDY